MSNYGLIIGLILMVITFIGCITFIVMYRPFNPNRHGPAGRHLLTMSWSLTALYGVSLLAQVVPIPRWLGQVLTVLVLGMICFAVWQRVALLRHVNRKKDSEEEDPCRQREMRR